jgi:hypothetical protein
MPPPANPVPIPSPPNKPEQYECCNRGCCPCIFDYYWDALARWEETVRSQGGDPDAVLAALGRVR